MEDGRISRGQSRPIAMGRGPSAPQFLEFPSICTYTFDAELLRCTCITSNRRHLLHPLLPPQQEQHYLLRKRSHGYKLPEHTSSLNDGHFLTRMLYKTLTDLMTFVDIFLYILIFIIWLWSCLVLHNNQQTSSWSITLMVMVCQPFIKLLLTYLLTYHI